MTRAWIPLVLVIVLVVAGFAVWRLRGMFASNPLPTYAGNVTEDSNKSDPKILRYEIWGEPGAVADINYTDAEGDATQLVNVPLPWSVDIETDAVALTGNVVAQGDGSFIGCRITGDGRVKDERTISNVSAYIYCIAKAS
ncbi:MmpS family transport accessory protein [Mycolicibacterium parafortuitum]|uniref:MmpS family transport accessory protein n=1 Tax=Mycolicibacterium parafortuitum TaxID=39692 RepID=UPI000DA2134E|nr:MmpS family transport accessory protein [Mycolicibacterium parafortuitum]